MTEPSSAEVEAQIEDGSLLEEQNTDAPEETVDENDKLEHFQQSTGWPNPGHEEEAFPGSTPQLDEGVQ